MGISCLAYDRLGGFLMNKELEVFISSCLKEYEYQSLGDSKNSNKQGINIRDNQGTVL